LAEPLDIQRSLRWFITICSTGLASCKHPGSLEKKWDCLLWLVYGQDMEFLAVLVVAVLIGVFAQTYKRRTGALWGFITLLVGLPWWIFNLIAKKWPTVAQEFGGTIELEITMVLFTGIPLLVVMGLIVLTLPNRKD